MTSGVLIAIVICITICILGLIGALTKIYIHEHPHHVSLAEMLGETNRKEGK